MLEYRLVSTGNNDVATDPMSSMELINNAVQRLDLEAYEVHVYDDTENPDKLLAVYVARITWEKLSSEEVDDAHPRDAAWREEQRRKLRHALELLNGTTW